MTLFDEAFGALDSGLRRDDGCAGRRSQGWRRWLAPNGGGLAKDQATGEERWILTPAGVTGVAVPSGGAGGWCRKVGPFSAVWATRERRWIPGSAGMTGVTMAGDGWAYGVMPSWRRTGLRGWLAAAEWLEPSLRSGLHAWGTGFRPAPE